MSKKNAKPERPKPIKGKSSSKGSSKKSSGASKPAKAKSTAPVVKMVADNRKVRHHYEIIESIECGMILQGSEVKSLRSGKCQLEESYGRVRGETLWLVGCTIAEYPQAAFWNHDPKRERQLLVKKPEMRRFIGKAKERGLTLIPLRIYFSTRGFAKCEIAICRGLKVHDKRERMKKNDARREIERAVRRRV